MCRGAARPTTVISSLTLSYDAAHATNPKALRQNTLQQKAAMQENVSHTLKKQHTKYTRYFDKIVSSSLTFAIGQQGYLDRLPLALITEDYKTSTQYCKLLLRTKWWFTVMNVSCHVIMIYNDGTPNTISIDRTTSVPTKAYMAAELALHLGPSARTIDHMTQARSAKNLQST